MGLEILYVVIAARIRRRYTMVLVIIAATPPHAARKIARMWSEWNLRRKYHNTTALFCLFDIYNLCLIVYYSQFKQLLFCWHAILIPAPLHVIFIKTLLKHNTNIYPPFSKNLSAPGIIHSWKTSFIIELSFQVPDPLTAFQEIARRIIQTRSRTQ